MISLVLTSRCTDLTADQILLTIQANLSAGLAKSRSSLQTFTSKPSRSKRELSKGAITDGRMLTNPFAVPTRAEGSMYAERGYKATDADGFVVPSSQPTIGNGKHTKPEAGKSSMANAH